MFQPAITPSQAIETLLRVATSEDLMTFVCNAIRVYFERVVAARETKLVCYGMRPLVSPIAAAYALDRSAAMDYSPAFLVRLIGSDEEAASLALRAVRFYAARFQAMPLGQLYDEVGGAALEVADAAGVVHRNLECIEG